MKKMRAIGCTRHGGAEVLEVCELPVPEPGPRDLLVRVHATAFNPVDAKVVAGARGGAKIEQPPLVAGFDASGVVERAGGACTRFAEGDAVFFAGDIGRRGSHAEYVLVDERIVGRKPARLSHAEAAALPLTSLTVWELLFEDMAAPVDGTGHGKQILVVGGGGGVGSIAVQLARVVGGLEVVATASREASRKLCLELGAAHVLDHSKDLVAESRALGHEAYPYVFSTASPANFDQLATLLAPLGRIGLILPPEKPVDLAPLFMKRGSVHLELMFVRPRAGIEVERQGGILDRVADLLDAGRLRTTLQKTLPWDRFREGYANLLSGHGLGKTVLLVRED